VFKLWPAAAAQGLAEHYQAEFYIHGGKPFTESKWKVHVSIGAPQLQTGWDIVYPLFVAARIHHIKVTRQSAMRAKANRIASGRQLTTVALQARGLDTS
jgi:hypothetical protein